MVKAIAASIALLLLIVGGYVCYRWYPYVFSRHVSGMLIDVQRVTDPQFAIIGKASPSPTALHSFAIAIRDKDGEIVTASTEDRQWAVARAGLCAEAEYLPYPPWDLAKKGTYFGARLLKLYDCPGSPPAGAAPSQAPPVPSPSQTGD